MAFLELKLYQNVRTIYPEDYAEYLIKAWKRFIDDCFVIWNKKYDLEPFLTMINSLDNSIKFTVEKSCNELPFLDVMVIKNSDNTISTDIHYKPTNSHRSLDFRSCHPHHTKVNVPFNLAQRICKIVSDTESRQHRLNELKSFLTSCFYPERLIDDAMKTAKEKTFLPTLTYRIEISSLWLSHTTPTMLLISNLSRIKSTMLNQQDCKDP